MAITPADVKYQEIGGALTAFNHAGLIKVAEEDLPLLCDAVFEKIGSNYNLHDIANAVDEVIHEVQNGEPMYKQAAYDDTLDYRVAIGDLTLMKIAGDINDYEYANGIDNLLKMAAGASSAAAAAKDPGKVKKFFNGVKNVLSGKNYQESRKRVATAKKTLDGFTEDSRAYKDVAKKLSKAKSGSRKELAKMLTGYGAIAGGVGGAGYGGYKALS